MLREIGDDDLNCHLTSLTYFYYFTKISCFILYTSHQTGTHTVLAQFATSKQTVSLSKGAFSKSANWLINNTFLVSRIFYSIIFSMIRWQSTLMSFICLLNTRGLDMWMAFWLLQYSHIANVKAKFAHPWDLLSKLAQVVLAMAWHFHFAFDLDTTLFHLFFQENKFSSNENHFIMSLIFF